METRSSRSRRTDRSTLTVFPDRAPLRLSGGAARFYVATHPPHPIATGGAPMARRYVRPQSPRGTTLGAAVLLWTVGALEMLSGIDLPYGLGRIALLPCGAPLILGCLPEGL